MQAYAHVYTWKVELISMTLTTGEYHHASANATNQLADVKIVSILHHQALLLTTHFERNQLAGTKSISLIGALHRTV